MASVVDQKPRLDHMRGIGPKKLAAFVGHHIQVLQGTYGYTGLLIRVDGKYAEIYQPRLRGTERFRISAVTFIRHLDKTPRPALAAAVAYERQWQDTDRALRGGDSEAPISDQDNWDRRRGEWEVGLIDIHQALMQELNDIPVCDLHPHYEGE
jgi:hypothetical protein